MYLAQGEKKIRREALNSTENPLVPQRSSFRRCLAAIKRERDLLEYSILKIASTVIDRGSPIRSNLELWA